MRFYFIAMTLRIACVASLFFVQGWWILLVGVGAVVLPYFAVMVANAVSNVPEGQPDQPSPLEILATALPTENTEGAAKLIVVDAEVHRRSSASNDAAHTPGENDDDSGGKRE